MSNILLIAASPGASSRSAQLLAAAGERLQHLGFAPTTLRLRDLPAEPLLRADTRDARIASAVRAVADARALVIATPIYKAAYSGLLKTFLDLLPPEALAGKTVWPLASGGSAAHLLALDYALGPVLAALGNRQSLAPVYATDAQLQAGDLDIGRRLAAGAAALLAQLAPPASFPIHTTAQEIA